VLDKTIKAGTTDRTGDVARFAVSDRGCNSKNALSKATGDARI